MTPFLTAVWTDLVLASYAVPDDLLLPLLPPGLSLDKRNGSAWCSLVGFDFSQMRVLGWSVPPLFGICDFPEFNLRFYVREGERRGVVFVRELVPTPLIALAARLTYNEKYSLARMTSRVTQVGETRRVRHDFALNGQRHTLAVTAHGPPADPPPGSLDNWIKEQGWGFGQTRGGKLIRYRVVHPHWRTYAVQHCDLPLDFEALYGPAWHSLQSRAPDAVTLAEGSHVAIYPQALI